MQLVLGGLPSRRYASACYSAVYCPLQVVVEPGGAHQEAAGQQQLEMAAVSS
jgi:hypothetical protein